MVFDFLIIDSNTEDIKIIESFLTSEKYDFNIVSINSYDKALELLENQDFHIIFCDENIENGSGLDLLKVVKSKNEKQTFIYSSTEFSKEIHDEATEAMANRVLYKPINEIVYRKAIFFFLNSIYKEYKLEESKKILQEYKDAIDDSAIVSKTDPKGKITYVNDSFCKISGYSREELIGSSHNIVKSPDTPRGVFGDMWRTILTKKVWTGDVKNRKKDGSYYWVKATISPITNSKDEIVEFIAIRTDITDEINQKQRELLENYQEIIFVLSEIAEKRSQETGVHVKRVAEYSYLLAKLYGLSNVECDLIRIASPMHDVGKLGIPDSILNKPGKLTDGEFNFMKDHSKIGYEMLNSSQVDVIKMAATIAHEHHEKWDGSGYPRALKADEISIYARIVAVVDVFDALSHDRVYKKAWEHEEVIKYIEENKNSHFDPKLVDLLLDNVDKFLEIKERFEKKKL